MTRGRSGALVTADTAASRGTAALVDFAFDSGTLRLSFARWNIVIGADTYYASGGGLAVSPWEEAADGQEGFQISLDGLDPAIFGLMVDEPYQGRIVRLLEQRYDADQATVGAPVVQSIGRIKSMSCDESVDAGSRLVTARCEQFDVDFNRPTELRFTDAEQRRRYQTDLGFEYVTSLVERVLVRTKK